MPVSYTHLDVYKRQGYDILEYEELLKCADVVSFHTALTPDTHHLLDARCISLMKDSAVVVNTSRGAVIDTLALAEALQADKLWGCLLYTSRCV